MANGHPAPRSEETTLPDLLSEPPALRGRQSPFSCRSLRMSSGGSVGKGHQEAANRRPRARSKGTTVPDLLSEPPDCHPEEALSACRARPIFRDPPHILARFRRLYLSQQTGSASLCELDDQHFMKEQQYASY